MPLLILHPLSFEIATSLSAISASEKAMECLHHWIQDFTNHLYISGHRIRLRTTSDFIFLLLGEMNHISSTVTLRRGHRNVKLEDLVTESHLFLVAPNIGTYLLSFCRLMQDLHHTLCPYVPTKGSSVSSVSEVSSVSVSVSISDVSSVSSLVSSVSVSSTSTPVSNEMGLLYHLQNRQRITTTVSAFSPLILML